MDDLRRGAAGQHAFVNRVAGSDEQHAAFLEHLQRVGGGRAGVHRDQGAGGAVLDLAGVEGVFLEQVAHDAVAGGQVEQLGLEAGMGSHPASERWESSRPFLPLRTSSLGTSRDGRAGGIASGHPSLRFAEWARRDAPSCIRTQKAALRAWVLIPPASVGVSRGLSWHFGLPHLELHEMVGLAGFEPTTPCPPGRCATRLRYSPFPSSATGG